MTKGMVIVFEHLQNTRPIESTCILAEKDGELFKKNNSYLLTPEVGAPVIPFADFHQ